jgi:hypothetical protein
MSQIGPDDAISNLSKWIGKIAIPPNWLKGPELDTIWTVAFSFMALLCLIAFFLPRRPQQRNTQASQLPDKTEQFKEELKHRAYLNRLALTGGQMRPKRSHAPPEGFGAVPVGSLSNRDLGDRIITLGSNIEKFVQIEKGRQSPRELINGYYAKYAPRFNYLYGEARNRGLSNSYLDCYYNDPESLENVLHIANEITRFGHVVKLYV